MLSGSIEVLTEQIGGGIPGLNKGTLDNWLMGMAQSNTGRAALKHLVNALGEGAEEFVSEIAGTYLAQMWNEDEPDFWQTLGDAFYAGLIGTLTSACMRVAGKLADLNNAHTVDTALNAMQNGDALSGEKLARAERAMQKLTGKAGSESPWNGAPAQEWVDTKSRYFDNYFPQVADLTGHTGDFSGIDTSNIIFLPTGDELSVLAKANADATAVPSTTTRPPLSSPPSSIRSICSHRARLRAPASSRRHISSAESRAPSAAFTVMRFTCSSRARVHSPFSPSASSVSALAFQARKVLSGTQ